MLQSRSPVLMNAIYTYQMCHWVTCQIFYIMPFCRTGDSWGRGVGFNALGFVFCFVFFLIQISRQADIPSQLGVYTGLKPTVEGISGELEFSEQIPWLSPILITPFSFLDFVFLSRKGNFFFFKLKLQKHWKDLK